MSMSLLLEVKKPILLKSITFILFYPGHPLFGGVSHALLTCARLRFLFCPVEIVSTAFDR